MIIVELSSNCRRQPTVGGADSSVGPVTHIISPDHSLQLFHRFRKINRVNAIIAKFLTILKLQPNRATLRSDLTQAVR